MDNEMFWLRRAVAERAAEEAAGSAAGELAPRPARVRVKRPERRGVERVQAERACCCADKPALVVVLPREHQPIDLLFCRRHYARSREALHAAGAVVVDAG
jgi:hypothetical protein